MLATQLSVNDLAGCITDGAKIALPPDYSYCALAAIRSLIRHRVRNLHVIGVPTLGFQGDMLIGAGCVETVETSAVTLSEFGLAPQFTMAIKNKSIKMMDATCPAIHAALQASEKGIPFMPLRGLIGSDILKYRADWKVRENPFAETYVTAEEITDTNLMDDTKTKAGTIPAIYITAISEVKRGAWPMGIPNGYDADREHLGLYAKMAKTKNGFQNYMEKFVFCSETVAAE
jgi:glutaconate CoA-transferase subunit A